MAAVQSESHEGHRTSLTVLHSVVLEIETQPTPTPPPAPDLGLKTELKGSENNSTVLSSDREIETQPALADIAFDFACLEIFLFAVEFYILTVRTLFSSRTGFKDGVLRYKVTLGVITCCAFISLLSSVPVYALYKSCKNKKRLFRICDIMLRISWVSIIGGIIALAFIACSSLVVAVAIVTVVVVGISFVIFYVQYN